MEKTYNKEYLMKSKEQKMIELKVALEEAMEAQSKVILIATKEGDDYCIDWSLVDNMDLVDLNHILSEFFRLSTRDVVNGIKSEIQDLKKEDEKNGRKG